METRLAYCSACDQDVRIAVTPMPLHGGQATLPDAPDVVCLDFGEKCTGAMCPMFGLPRILMGVRLARSGLKQSGWRTIHGPCQGCGEIVDLQILDARYVYCPACGTRSRWVRLEGQDEDYVALAEAP